ncbi:MAG: LysR family transcriptional regulator [Clostridia bacterium]|nr:LysR family transcriptional regulator [Clostridia bacterium]NCC42835.1 LysR family transcriptional regulator [Clostridia bacterium]
MELRHIRYFLTVANELSFTKAAEELCIAQPPLSRQIHDLESELGVKLFIRSPKALKLTEEGLLFKQQAQQILALVEKSTEEVQELKNGLSGTLFLGSVEGYGPKLMSEWIRGFQKKYAHVHYNLWNGNSDDVTDRLLKGLCDLAIIAEPYNAESLEAIHIYKEPWVAMIPAGNPLAKSKDSTIELEKLSSEELILPSRNSRIDEIKSWFRNFESQPTIRCVMSHMTNAYELTEQGVGIAIFPASAAEFTDPKKVVIKEIIKPGYETSYVLVWDKNRKLSGLVETFVDYVRNL